MAIRSCFLVAFLEEGVEAFFEKQAASRRAILRNSDFHVKDIMT